MIFQSAFANVIAGGHMITAARILFPKMRFWNASDPECEGLQRKVDKLKNTMDVHIPIKVIQGNFYASTGSEWNGAGWIIAPFVHQWIVTKSSDDLQTAILAHEIAHIKHNDCPWRAVAIMITMIVHTFFVWTFFPAGWIAFGENLLLVSLLAMKYLFISQERAADQEASRYLTDSQKLALSDSFEETRKEHIELRNNPQFCFSKLIMKHLITSDGEYLLAYTHPSLKSRAKFFRNQVKPLSRKSPVSQSLQG